MCSSPCAKQASDPQGPRLRVPPDHRTRQNHPSNFVPQTTICQFRDFSLVEVAPSREIIPFDPIHDPPLGPMMTFPQGGIPVRFPPPQDPGFQRIIPVGQSESVQMAALTSSETGFMQDASHIPFLTIQRSQSRASDQLHWDTPIARGDLAGRPLVWLNSRVCMTEQRYVHKLQPWSSQPLEPSPRGTPQSSACVNQTCIMGCAP